MASPRRSPRASPGRAASGEGSSIAAWDEALRLEHGVELLGGVDEAGRGALAGPVVAAAVVLGPGVLIPGVDDSKKLSAADREACVPRVLAAARTWAVAAASAAEVDRIDVLRATHLAMRRALAGLSIRPQFLVLDHVRLADDPTPALSIPRADSTSLCVAAASILAKVARDRLMARLDAEFPGYGLAMHKGYGTAAHWAALEREGPSAIHRITFRGVGGDMFAAPLARGGTYEPRDAARASVRDGAADSPDASSPDELAGLLRVE